LHLGVINDGGNAANDESVTSVMARTTLVATIAGGANAALRVRNLGSGGAGVHAFGAHPGGDGIVGEGGQMFQAVGADDGRGVVAIGGDGTVTGVNGGIGLDAEGGSSMNQTGGQGVQARGGSSDSGSGGIGVQGTGGAGPSGGEGVVGFGGGTGGTQGNGVRGQTNSTANAGVLGSNSGTGPGVFGHSGSSGNGSGIGVRGQSGSGAGVQGESTSGIGLRGTSASSFAVYGTASGPTFGVVGDSAGGGGGVLGVGQTNYGAAGVSAQGNGLLGQAEGAGFGVVGISQVTHGVLGHAVTSGYGVAGLSQSGAGVLGQALSGNALAGLFVGNVQIQGTLHVNGVPVGSAGANAATLEGGQQTADATEPLVEDVGEARIERGRAEVQLDRAFVSRLRGASYQVFLTAYEANLTLHVEHRGRDSFEVRSSGSGAQGGSFGYRVVARVRGGSDRGPAANDARERPANTPVPIQAPRPIEPRELPKPLNPKELPQTPPR
jgi:hypothetical protein